MRLETMYSETSDRVATIVLDRPEVLNCANAQWARDLNTVADDIMRNEHIRLVVLRGAGRAFCSGIDLGSLSRGEIGMAFFRDWETALRKLEKMDPVVIAAIQSHCIGGGLQLALACDLRVARDDARFGVTAAREGIIPGIGMWRIARYAGLGRAKRLALAADVVDATTALEWGLVDWVADAETFEAKVSELVERASTMTWTSTRLTKKLTNMALEASYADFVETYYEYQAASIASAEHREAIAEYRARHPERKSTNEER
jgi:enoyl-CoA hydratase/carnithine racemase